MAVQFMLRTQSDDRLSQKNNVPHHKATIDPGEPCTLLKYSDSIGIVTTGQRQKSFSTKKLRCRDIRDMVY